MNSFYFHYVYTYPHPNTDTHMYVTITYIPKYDLPNLFNFNRMCFQGFLYEIGSLVFVLLCAEAYLPNFCHALGACSSLC